MSISLTALSKSNDSNIKETVSVDPTMNDALQVLYGNPTWNIKINTLFQTTNQVIVDYTMVYSPAIGGGERDRIEITHNQNQITRLRVISRGKTYLEDQTCSF